VLGIDNINNYYDKSLKIARINNLKKKKNFTFVKCDLNQKKKLENLIKKFKPHIVLNLAAQAGVRYSIKNPDAYIKSNILGFQNLIELCAKYKVKNFLYASSSSVYGLNNNKLNQEADDTDQPLSLYAATKKSNENIAHVYSYIYGIKTTGLRFFTVYGPWGRPDMALFKFVQNILRNKKITVFNGGKMKRSFTYIDDVVLSLKKIIFKKNNPNKKLHDVLNIGGDRSVKLDRFILEIERNLNTKAKKIFLPIQMGDVKNTSADTTKLKNYIGYQPKTPINIGIKKFVSWYKNFYRVN